MVKCVELLEIGFAEIPCFRVPKEEIQWTHDIDVIFDSSIYISAVEYCLNLDINAQALPIQVLILVSSFNESSNGNFQKII